MTTIASWSQSPSQSIMAVVTMLNKQDPPWLSLSLLQFNYQQSPLITFEWSHSSWLWKHASLALTSWGRVSGPVVSGWVWGWALRTHHAQVLSVCWPHGLLSVPGAMNSIRAYQMQYMSRLLTANHMWMSQTLSYIFYIEFTMLRTMAYSIHHAYSVAYIVNTESSR